MSVLKFSNAALFLSEAPILLTVWTLSVLALFLFKWLTLLFCTSQLVFTWLALFSFGKYSFDYMYYYSFTPVLYLCPGKLISMLFGLLIGLNKVELLLSFFDLVVILMVTCGWAIPALPIELFLVFFVNLVGFICCIDKLLRENLKRNVPPIIQRLCC